MIGGKKPTAAWTVWTTAVGAAWKSARPATEPAWSKRKARPTVRSAEEGRPGPRRRLGPSASRFLASSVVGKKAGKKESPDPMDRDFVLPWHESSSRLDANGLVR